MLTIRFPQFNYGAWIRTCQECGLAQIAPCPLTPKSDSWRNAKCKKCKSEALDYGMANVLVDYDEESE